MFHHNNDSDNDDNDHNNMSMKFDNGGDDDHHKVQFRSSIILKNNHDLENGTRTLKYQNSLRLNKVG